MRSSQVVRASDCQCRSPNSPGFDPSILRHSGILGAADEAVFNSVPVHSRKKSRNPPVFFLSVVLKKILFRGTCLASGVWNDGGCVRSQQQCQLRRQLREQQLYGCFRTAGRDTGSHLQARGYTGRNYAMVIFSFCLLDPRNFLFRHVTTDWPLYPWFNVFESGPAWFLIDLVGLIRIPDLGGQK